MIIRIRYKGHSMDSNINAKYRIDRKLLSKRGKV